jgi:hypothetical protein
MYRQNLKTFYSRKDAKNAKKIKSYNFLPQKPLRALRPGERLFFLSLAEAQRSQRTSMLILWLPQTPLRALRLGESNINPDCASLYPGYDTTIE